MIEKAFNVAGKPSLDIRIERGKVEVRQGEEGRVSVSVDTDDPDFIVEQRGSSIIISSEKGRGWKPASSTFVVVDTPRDSDLDVSVATAEVQVDVPLDRADVKTASGDVDLAGAEILTVKTASGDVRVEHVGKAMRFTTASGDLFVTGEARGTVGISTASGDVRIDDCEATVDINSVSGDVFIPRFSGRSGNFKGMSGDVNLGVLQGTSLDLDVNLLSGKLYVPDALETRPEIERHMSVKAKLVSGDLKIERV